MFNRLIKKIEKIIMSVLKTEVRTKRNEEHKKENQVMSIET